MDERTVMAGIEVLVGDLDRAIALWVDVLGFELVDSGPASHIEGRFAVVTDGRLAVTLLEPADAGPGTVLADRTPRLSQIVLTDPAPDAPAGRAVEAGLSVVPTADGFFLAPEVVAGALGPEVAVVVTGRP